MTLSPWPVARRIPLLACLLAGILPVAMVSPGSAQPTGGLTAAPVLAVGSNEAATSRRIDLTMGRSLVIDLPRDAKEVFVANPKVANAVVRSTR